MTCLSLVARQFALKIWPFLAGILVVSSICPRAGAQVDNVKPQPRDPLFWVFLTTGKSSQGIEKAELEKMQGAHLDNFGRLHAEGKLFMAGPMVDPEQKIRGIVVVTAADVASLPKLFEPDPFVQHGLLTIDAIAMEMVVGRFQGNVDPKSLAEYQLVLLEKASLEAEEVAPEMQAKNHSYCETLHTPERLCFAGWLRDEQRPRRGILIFRKLDEKLLRSLLDEIPSVKSTDSKYTIFPLYMSAGSVE